ncbi:MAG: pyridoxal-phosphate dependent enzyme [Saprospiraceae bacterium]|nr:pyridoxal-phosphate dependent enzyme [Saprospiraceae bacterium]
MSSLQQLHTIPTKEELEATYAVVKNYVHNTPVLSSSSINELLDCQLFFKCENFQKIGAFKMRGGISAASRLSEEERQKGLATHSSGNHAQAIAYSAKMYGVPAYIVMPSNAPKIKKQAVEGYGANIIECAPTMEAREQTLIEVVKQTGATFIHSYNNYNVIAGQSTSAQEFIDKYPDLDIMMTPIGGGGLISGTALAVHYFGNTMQMIGAEPIEADDAYRSFKSGILQGNETTNTIADGLRTPLRDKTFGIIRKHVDDILRVTEESIVQAMRLIWERMKIIIEPSCAVPLAAVMLNKERFAGKKIGIILSGGNVDLGKLPF